MSTDPRDRFRERAQQRAHAFCRLFDLCVSTVSTPPDAHSPACAHLGDALCDFAAGMAEETLEEIGGWANDNMHGKGDWWDAMIAVKLHCYKLRRARTAEKGAVSVSKPPPK